MGGQQSRRTHRRPPDIQRLSGAHTRPRDKTGQTPHASNGSKKVERLRQPTTKRRWQDRRRRFGAPSARTTIVLAAALAQRSHFSRILPRPIPKPVAAFRGAGRASARLSMVGGGTARTSASPAARLQSFAGRGQLGPVPVLRERQLSLSTSATIVLHRCQPSGSLGSDHREARRQPDGRHPPRPHLKPPSPRRASALRWRSRPLAQQVVTAIPMTSRIIASGHRRTGRAEPA